MKFRTLLMVMVLFGFVLPILSEVVEACNRDSDCPPSSYCDGNVAVHQTYYCLDGYCVVDEETTQTCPNGCSGGECNSCIPDCAGKECGSDGCGGSCGNCGGSQDCENGQCVEICIPDCTGKECGPDGCGGTCGSCSAGETCSNGQCVPPSEELPCTPNCAGKECGPDGCGGACGSCSAGETCSNGQCVPPSEESPNDACGDFGSAAWAPKYYCRNQVGPDIGYDDCVDYGERAFFYVDDEDDDLIKYYCKDWCNIVWPFGCSCNNHGNCHKCSSGSGIYQNCVDKCNEVNGYDCDSECVQAVDCSPSNSGIESSSHRAGCEYLDGQTCTNDEGDEGICSQGKCNPCPEDGCYDSEYRDYFPSEGVCVYDLLDQDETEAYCCSPHEWNIGGEISATTCCGDDSNEFNNYRKVSNTMDNESFSSSTLDKACCDSKNDCIYNNICYSAGFEHGDVDDDGDDDVCLIDSSGFSKWFDCSNNAQCGGDSSKSICDKTSQDCIEVDCNNHEDDDHDGDADGEDEDCKPHISYTGEIGYCPASMIKDGNEPCFISKDEGCVPDGGIVNDLLCSNGHWHSRQSMGFASLYENRDANFILKCDSLNLNIFQSDDLFNSLNYGLDYSFYSPEDIISRCVQSTCYLASSDKMAFLFNLDPDDKNCFRGYSPSYIFSNVAIDDTFTADSNSRESFEKYPLENGGALFYNNYTKQFAYSNTTDFGLSLTDSYDDGVLGELYAGLSNLAGQPNKILNNSLITRSLIYYDVGDVLIQGKNAQNATSSPNYDVLYTVSVLYDGLPDALSDFLNESFEEECSAISESCKYFPNNLFYSSVLDETKINKEFWPYYTSMLFSSIR